MAHRSRLAGFIIDSQVDDLPAASAFWGAALGLAVTDPDDGGLGIYDKFEPGPGGLHIEVQKVAHPSRVHLDIETDDIEAEVRRLEALGAKRVQQVRNRWWVMEAPTGHRFCVVPMNAGAPRGEANAWG
ncbi:MAG TPA: VOC family protein [Luteimonas sp.]|nr:VOC family protein [Luteimonas sp.]HRP73493.1 VOC family protein [Luteimonas sp.]